MPFGLITNGEDADLIKDHLNSFMRTFLLGGHHNTFYNSWAEFNSGSANWTADRRAVMNGGTGNTASSRGEISRTALGDTTPWATGGDSYKQINWDKEILLCGRISVYYGQPEFNRLIVLGATNGGAHGGVALNGKSLGIRIEHWALKGIVHNGTTEYEVDLGLTMSQARGYCFAVHSKGDGNVDFYIDQFNTPDGTLATGPTGMGVTNETGLVCITDNGTYAGNCVLDVGSLQVLIDPA